jgi:hypothetical protein
VRDRGRGGRGARFAAAALVAASGAGSGHGPAQSAPRAADEAPHARGHRFAAAALVAASGGWRGTGSRTSAVGAGLLWVSAAGGGWGVASRGLLWWPLPGRIVSRAGRRRRRVLQMRRHTREVTASWRLLCWPPPAASAEPAHGPAHGARCCAGSLSPGRGRACARPGVERAPLRGGSPVSRLRRARNRVTGRRGWCEVLWGRAARGKGRGFVAAVLVAASGGRGTECRAGAVGAGFCG